jgi:hypothetical protein
MSILVLAGTSSWSIHLAPAQVLGSAPETEQMLVAQLADKEGKVICGLLCQ